MDLELLLAQNPLKVQVPPLPYQIQMFDRLLRMDSALSLVQNLPGVLTPLPPP